MIYEIEEAKHESFNVNNKNYVSFIYHKKINTVLKVSHGNTCQAVLIEDYKSHGFRVSAELPKYILSKLSKIDKSKV